MAQFSIDFSGETTGAAPANFTENWTATGQTWAVREKAGELGGKGLEHVRTTTARRGFSWDTPGSDTDTEILVRWRSTAATSTDQFWMLLRGSGAAATEGGYIFRNTSGTSIQIARLVAGTLTTIGAAVTITAIANNQWYWMRFRVNGTDLKAKIWNGDHDQEPAAWTIERTDATIALAGWMGVGNAAATGTRDYDDIAVGTAGDTAVFPVSAEARVTQAPVLVLSAADSDVRVTQVPVLVLAFMPDAAEEIRVTQAVTLALAEFTAETRITQAVALVLADHIPCVQRWATCWTFTRTDGLVLGYTSHDQTVMFRGVEHVPCNSLAASAVEMSSIVGSTGSIDLIGLLSDAGVSERDIYNGLYDGANIEVWLVPWSNAGGETPIRLIAGVVGTNGHETASYNQELLTEGQRLQQRALLETITPGCRFLFGNQVDPRCPVDLSLLEVTGSVTALAIPNASTDSARRIFNDSTRVEADGFFSLGRVTWTTGANVGAVSEVKDFIGGQFILWESLLFPIDIADEYIATPGCDKSPAAHLTFEPDMKKFGGFPFVSGPDMLMRRPDAKG